MSIILDALRRADAERQRAKGAPPGLAELANGPAWSTTVSRPRWWVGLTALLAGAALLLGGWWWGARGTEAAPTEGARGRAETGAPAVPASSQAMEAPLQVRAADRLPVPPQPLPPVVAIRAEAAPPAVSAPPPPQRPTAVTAARASASSSAGAAPLPTLAQLGAAARAGLPTLKVDGVMHSEQASSRLLFLNGQMLHEGDSAAPGLVLERIGARAAVLRWHDQRFELPY